MKTFLYALTIILLIVLHLLTGDMTFIAATIVVSYTTIKPFIK